MRSVVCAMLIPWFSLSRLLFLGPSHESPPLCLESPTSFLASPMLFLASRTHLALRRRPRKSWPGTHLSQQAFARWHEIARSFMAAYKNRTNKGNKLAPLKVDVPCYTVFSPRSRVPRRSGPLHVDRKPVVTPLASILLKTHGFTN